MNFNDLEKEIAKNNLKSKVILQGIDFSDYGGYEGDWQNEQYIIYHCKTKK